MVERNRKAGQNPPRVVASSEEEDLPSHPDRTPHHLSPIQLDEEQFSLRHYVGLPPQISVNS
jgi:hypothetical protein